MKVIRGKRALVTGAANGIGRSIARALAEEGASLWLVDIDAEGLQAVAAGLRTPDAQVVATVCDLADPQDIGALTAAVLKRWGGLEILVNNAGIGYYGPTENMTAEHWKQVTGINLLAPIQLIHELLPTMLGQSEGHIVNIASIAGHVATRRVAAYHATKYALVGLSESLRAEHGPHGLGVTAICPGFVDTHFFDACINGREKPIPHPPAWACMSPEKVARVTVRAIKKDRGVVLTGVMSQVLWRVKRFAPWLVDKVDRFSRHRRKPGQPMVRIKPRAPAVEDAVPAGTPTRL